MKAKLLTIIIPIYNEEKIITAYLPKIFNLKINKEIIIINDGSIDKTQIILQELKQKYNFQLINHPHRQGKGAAVKRALAKIQGDYFIVCDADAEYEALDIIYLFQKIKKINSSKLVIYGSRFLGKSLKNWHYLVNKFLTELTNLLFHSHLSDMETCFKLIPTRALKDLKLTGGGFEIEPELTAQLLKANYHIKELPIHYTRRSYKEGKKIKARDGLLAIKTLIKEKLFD